MRGYTKPRPAKCSGAWTASPRTRRRRSIPVVPTEWRRSTPTGRVGTIAKHVTMDDKNLRPSEVYNLRGDASKAKRILGWEAKTRFKDLVRKMVEAEIRALEEARPAS